MNNRQRRWLGLFLICLLAFAAVAGAVYFGGRGSDCETVLHDSRAALEAAARHFPDARNLAEMQEFADPLRQCLGSDGDHSSTAELFLCASLSAKRYRTGRLSSPERDELERLPTQLDMQRCSTSDLHLAGRLFLLTEDLAIARPLAEELVRRREQPTAALQLAIEIARAEGDDNSLLTYCYELSDVAKDDPQPWVLIAEVYESRGYKLQLTRVYPEIIKRWPEKSVEYRRRLLRTLIDVGEIDQAELVFNQLRNENPRVLADDPLLEPQLLHLQGNVARAETLLRQILERDAADVAAAVLLGQVLLSNERPAEAIALLEPLAEKETANAPLFYVLGTAYSSLGQEDAAYRFLARHRDLKVARLTIDKIRGYLRNNPINARLASELARSYATIGDVEESRYWQQAADRLTTPQQH